jgi:hypothetical protein
VIGNEEGVPNDVPAREEEVTKEVKEDGVLSAPPMLLMLFKAPPPMAVAVVVVLICEVYDVEELSSNE